MTTTDNARRKTMPQRVPEQWDHETRCADYQTATARRDEMRSTNPQVVGGRRVRYRVRRCPVCHRWYTMRELRKAGA